MAIPGRKAQILVEAVDGTRTAMDSVERNLASVNNAAQKLSGILGKVFLATAAIEFGRKFTEAAIQAEQASNRLTAVLRATGHSAGLTKAELDKMADSFAQSTQFDDESVREAQATLLKFGNIQEEVFKRALKLAADYASFTGSAIPEAAQTIGKALASPADGTMMLERQIGKFNPVAEQMIKNFIAAGEHAKAQGLILDVLAGKIGGTAEQMNTGLFAATNKVKLAWNEMLESFGRSSAMQKPVSGLMKEVENYLVNIKDIVENGDWVEKTLALFALFPSGGVRRFNLSRPSQSPTDLAAAQAGAERGRREQQEAAAWAEVAETDKWFDQWLEQRRQKEKTAGDKRMRENEKIAQAEVDVEEMAAQDTAEAWKFWNEHRLADEKKFLEDKQKMWQAVFEQIDREQEDAIEQGRILLEGLEDQTKKNEDAARSLGLVFVSAAEESFRHWQGFSHLLKGIGQDIAMIIFRKGITEPLAGGISDWAKTVNWTGMFSGLFGGSRQGGGPVEAGRMYQVAEQGPELLRAGGRQYLMMGAQGGLVSAAGAGGAGQVINIYPDLRGASAEAVVALHRMVRDLRANVPSLALAAVADANLRGRRW